MDRSEKSMTAIIGGFFVVMATETIIQKQVIGDMPQLNGQFSYGSETFLSDAYLTKKGTVQKEERGLYQSASGMEGTRRDPEKTFTSEELDTGRAQAVVNAYWQRRQAMVVSEMFADGARFKPNTLAKIQEERDQVDALIATVAGKEGTSLITGIQLNTFFTTIESVSSWFNKPFIEGDPEELRNPEILTYVGLDVTKTAPLLGALAGLSRYFIEERNLEKVSSQESKKTVMDRYQAATVATQYVNQTRGEVFSYNPQVHKEALIRFYRQQMYHTQPPPLEKILKQTSEWLLKERVGRDVVPFGFKWFSDFEEQGMIPASFNTIVEFNQGIIEGKTTHLYCCPNYATERRDDGVVVYTFESLGTGIGLTAEKGLPIINSIIKRIQELKNKGEDIRNPKIHIGIADYEATQANADLVGMTLPEFRAALAGSMQSIIKTFQEEYGGNATVLSAESTTTFEPSLPIHQVEIKDGRSTTQVTVSAITFLHGTQFAPGKTSFDQKVELMRLQLQERSQTDALLQRQLDMLLKLRLGLLLRWRDGSEPEIIQQLGNLYDSVSQGEFAIEINNFTEFNGLVGEINGIIKSEEYSEKEKDEIIKAMIVNWMVKVDGKKTNSSVLDGLAYMRSRVATQGAEYAVMSDEIANKRGMHITADSAPMWEVFGNKDVTRLARGGGYEGA